jgi:hypothetical protein
MWPGGHLSWLWSFMVSSVSTANDQESFKMGHITSMSILHTIYNYLYSLYNLWSWLWIILHAGAEVLWQLSFCDCFYSGSNWIPYITQDHHVFHPFQYLSCHCQCLLWQNCDMQKHTTHLNRYYILHTIKAQKHTILQVAIIFTPGHVHN